MVVRLVVIIMFVCMEIGSDLRDYGEWVMYLFFEVCVLVFELFVFKG